MNTDKLLEQIREIILIVDQKSIIRYQSHSTVRVLGYPVNSMLGKSLLDFVAVDNRELVAKHLDDNRRFALQVLHQEGFILHMQADIQAVNEPEDGGLIITLWDETQLKARGLAIQRLTVEPDPTTDSLYQQLTTREKEIFQLVAEGYTSVEIANQLVISRRTVDSHRASIMEKLQLPHISALVRFAIKQKVISLD